MIKDPKKYLTYLTVFAELAWFCRFVAAFKDFIFNFLITGKELLFASKVLSFRDYVWILILGGLLVIDRLFLFLFSFLKPQIPPCH